MFWTNIEYFNEKEFACPCCGRVEMNDAFIYKLDAVRELGDMVMIINSGFRCPAHNKDVGGKINSSHLFGLAVDVKTFSSRGRYRLMQAALSRGINRIGIAKDFIHLDVDIDKPQNLIWTY